MVVVHNWGNSSVSAAWLHFGGLIKAKDFPKDPWVELSNGERTRPGNWFDFRMFERWCVHAFCSQFHLLYETPFCWCAISFTIWRQRALLFCACVCRTWFMRPFQMLCSLNILNIWNRPFQSALSLSHCSYCHAWLSEIYYFPLMSYYHPIDYPINIPLIVNIPYSTDLLRTSRPELQLCGDSRDPPKRMQNVRNVLPWVAAVSRLSNMAMGNHLEMEVFI